MERWRIGCRCAIVLARHFCILLLRERGGEGLVVLPSSSSNETTAHAFRVALDTSSSSSFTFATLQLHTYITLPRWS